MKSFGEEKEVTKQINEPTIDTNTEIRTSFENNKEESKEGYGKNTTLFIILCIVAVLLGIAVELFNRNSVQDNKDLERPKYWVLSRLKNEDYVLKHVHSVLERFGYKRTNNETPWDLLWSHDFPFSMANLHNLKPHQKVNHFPGTLRISQKVEFVTNKHDSIPKSFRLPKDKEDFLKYASENKRAMFVQKNNQHRGVVLKNVTDVDTGGEKFVQEYIQNPFLVDGYKFDIGVYVVITSVDPLRIYYYNGDVLLRFCPEKYYPFDPLNMKKYVVADDYRPIWEVPAMAQMHNMGYNMKDSLDVYFRAQAKDPNKIWEEVFTVIRDNLVNKEKYITEALKKYSSSSNFFEMFRVDLMLDENAKVHLMEANMSPNLVSPRPTNQLLYEQVLYNLFSLVGLSEPFRQYRSSYSQIDCGNNSTNPDYTSCVKNKAGANMLASNKNIAVWGKECNNSCAENCDGICAVCRRCLTLKDSLAFIEAYREHLRKGDFKRLFPPPMTPTPSVEGLKDLTPKNWLMHLWYQGKCNVDVAWCS